MGTSHRALGSMLHAKVEVAPEDTCEWILQAKEERLAEKAKKKATAKKMEEVEARRKQEEEARRLRWLQQVRLGGDREAVGWDRHCLLALRTGWACPF